MSSMNEKDFPLAVTRILDKIQKIRASSVSIYKDGNMVVGFKDTDPDSKFYFVIWKVVTEKGIIRMRIRQSPSSEIKLDAAEYMVGRDFLLDKYKKWQKIVLEYGDYNINPDSPIIEHYSNEFFTNYEIVDEDGDVPFSAPKLLALDAHIDRIIEVVEANLDPKEGQAIIQDCQEMKETMTKSSKNQNLRKLSKIHSKVMYHGLKLLKAIWDETYKQLIKLGVTSGLSELTGLF